MHIMEGFLPPQWCLFWYIVSFIVVIYGIIKIKKLTEESPQLKPLIAVSGAFMFVLSALKIPTAFGSSTHPTGSALSAVIFGPAITSVLATIVLLFQALLLAHGGISTLGANIFSMGIIGPAAAWLIYKGTKKLGLNSSISIFLAAFFASLMTYATTGVQLALAFPIPTFEAAFLKFIAIFAYTQIPIAVIEGFVTIKIWDYIMKSRPDILEGLNLTRSKAVMENKFNKKHLILLLCTALIIVTPFALNISINGGTDDLASNEIQNLGYKPWFESIWIPPSDNVETLIFASQAAIGLIIIGYFIGYYKKKQNS